MQDSLTDTVRRLLAARLRRPGWVLLVELFIGFGWMRAVVEKLIDPNWWSGEVITGFIDDTSGHAVGWYRSVLVEVWAPMADSLALVVVVLQLVAALTLLSGRHVGVGLSVGMFLNLHFVLAGAVDPSIFYLVCQGALGLWLLERRTDAGAREALEWLNVGAVVLVCAAVPMVRTIHPAEVIDDPAMVLATLGMLVFVSTTIVLARSSRRAAAADARSGPAGAFVGAPTTESLGE